MSTNSRFVKKLLNPDSIFLLDGLGATVSAIMLGGILPFAQDRIGMPPSTLYFLAIFPIAYAAYSLTCHYLRLSRWEPFLKGIAVANAIYCLLSIGLLVVHWGQLTTPGAAYFFGEIAIIFGLAIYEWKLAQRGY